MREADMVKKRIQVTSWPLYRRPGDQREDYKKVATGIVDPALSLLDPKVHWIKHNQVWQEIRLRGLSSSTATFLAVGSNADIAFSAKSLARFVKVSAPDQTPQWIVYRDMSKESFEKMGEVARLGPLMPTEGMAVVPCSGAPIPLNEIDDLIVANAGFMTAPCGP